MMIKIIKLTGYSNGTEYDLFVNINYIIQFNRYDEDSTRIVIMDKQKPEFVK